VADLRVIKISGTAPVDVDWRVIKVSGTVTPYSTANAGADQTVDSYASVSLSGALSQNASTYAWTQVSGSPTVSLTGASTSSASFTAPATEDGTALVFRLTCDSSSTDDVTITVRCHNRWKYNGSTWEPMEAST
jgi:hypothetical protein